MCNVQRLDVNGPFNGLRYSLFFIRNYEVQKSSGNRGKYTELMSYSKHLEDLHEKLVNIYLEHSTCTREQIEELLKNETWMNAETYKSLGLIDEIIG